MGNGKKGPLTRVQLHTAEERTEAEHISIIIYFTSSQRHGNCSIRAKHSSNHKLDCLQLLYRMSFLNKTWKEKEKKKTEQVGNAEIGKEEILVVCVKHARRYSDTAGFEENLRQRQVPS